MDFDAMCEAYFEKCDDRVVEKWDSKAETVIGVSQPEPYLKSGLALYLEVTTQTMLAYSKDKDGPFSSIIKRAYDRIQNDLEMRAIVNNKQAVGCLFNLKCNHGMIEANRLEVKQTISFEDMTDDELDNTIESLSQEVDD
jgi:hypothetical protein